MIKDQETLDTYNRESQNLKNYFRTFSRSNDINLALELAGKTNGDADVLEVGCGDGRDALEIVGKAKSYKGLDYSEGMLKIARETLPDVEFEQARLEDYEFPDEAYDVVFAFAVFLHLDRETLGRVLQKIGRTLRPGGILFMSNKYGKDYKAEMKHDQFGDRMFYFYNPDIIAELAGDTFKPVANNRDSKDISPWFQTALRKI